jgi:hypothetical protein
VLDFLDSYYRTGAFDGTDQAALEEIAREISGSIGTVAERFRPAEVNDPSDESKAL